MQRSGSVQPPAPPLSLSVGADDTSLNTATPRTIRSPVFTPAGMAIATLAALFALAVAPVLSFIAIRCPRRYDAVGIVIEIAVALASPRVHGHPRSPAVR